MVAVHAEGLSTWEGLAVGIMNIIRLCLDRLLQRVSLDASNLSPAGVLP